MSTIHVLPPHQAQKIAAGEVIGRPAHVVKEIIENALDAQARTITLHINDAGKTLIRLVDDGIGMSPQDAAMCFLPHATSKIRTLEDLVTLTSFGFRGEALASIAAVARVTLLSKTHQQRDSLGTQVTIDEYGGVHTQPAACLPGSDLSIRELFYNTPARKKFLKRDETEWNQIEQIFVAFALGNPAIHFKLFRDEKLILNAPATPNDHTTRIRQVWGEPFALQLTPLVSKHQESYIQLEGLIGVHQFWRYNKDAILLFVNNRLVSNRELTKAVLAGYQNVLPPQRFPAACLFIWVNPHDIDVNVHPQKSEVLFTHPQKAATLVRDAIVYTLEERHRRLLQPATTTYSAPLITPTTHLETTPLPASVQAPLHETAWSVAPGWHETPPLFAPELPVAMTHTQHVLARTPSYRIIGQLMNTYIVLEHEQSCIILDQHAAHERILYEKFKKDFSHVASVTLVTPVLLTMSEHHISILLTHSTAIAQHGFHLKHIGQHQVAITSTPPEFARLAPHSVINELVELLDTQTVATEDMVRMSIHEHMHSHRACKAAVKAGDVLTHETMQRIITDLYACDNRYICAHGRPTIWEITQASLEKQFRRKL